MTTEELQAQLLELQTENTGLKKAVSDRDRDVTRHLGESKRLQTLLDGKDPDEGKDSQTAAEKALELRATNLGRKETVINLAIERGIKPAEAFELLGLGDGSLTDEERLDLSLDREKALRQDERDRVLKENGRTPGSGVKLHLDPMGLAELNKLPDDQLRQLDPSIVGDAVDAEIKANKKTRRESISANLGV